MTREEALALLDAFRLDREAPSAVSSEQMARRFVALLRAPPRPRDNGPARPDRGGSAGAGS